MSHESNPSHPLPAGLVGVAVDFDPFAADPAAAAIEQVITPTDAQREVWLADHLGREASLAYNEAVELDLRGPLDDAAVTRLQGACQAVHQAHQALRAVFSDDGSEMLVQPADAAPLVFDVVDLRMQDESTGRSSKPDFQARFMMDGLLIERDAYWGGKWRNVVVGTTGAGPKAMFAMDVTNTDFNGLKDSVLWELSDANQAVQAHGDAIGHVLQEPEVGVLADGRWVVVTGNGYESRSRRAQLLVIELSTGNVLARLDTGVGSNAQPNGLGGVTLVRDGNQVITAAYAGDLRGNLWKFDLASTTVSDWKVSYGQKPMFTTDDERPITAPPTTVTHPLGGVMVLVGTGKLFEVGDNKRPDTARGQTLLAESIYGLWDYTRLVSDEKGKRAWVDGRQKDKDGVPIARSAVKTRKLNVIGSRYLAQTPFDDKANGILDWRKDSGWRIRLVDMIALGGQRNIIAPQLMSSLTLFETMSPVVDEELGACAANVNTPGFSLDYEIGRASCRERV